MGTGEGYAEMLGVHDHKITKELLHLLQAATVTVAVLSFYLNVPGRDVYIDNLL